MLTVIKDKDSTINPLETIEPKNITTKSLLKEIPKYKKQKASEISEAFAFTTLTIKSDFSTKI